MTRLNKTIPIWHADKKIWIYRPSIDGVQKKYTSRIEGKGGAAECKRKYNAALAGAGGGTRRLGDVWVEFLEDRKKRLGEQSDGYRKAKCFGELHILPALKMKRVGKITSQDWQDILNNAKKIDGGKLSKKSLMNIRGEITAFCRYAVKAEIMDRMPFDLTIPKHAPVVGKNILQPDQAKTLLTDEPVDWWHRMWQLQLVTGLRPGEAAGLQRNDVVDGLIVVRRSLNSKNELTAGKNNTAKRTIVQTAQAAKIIADQIAMLDKNNIGLPWLFPDKIGCLAKPKTIADRWNKYAAKFNTRLTQYCLRHTFVSLMQNDLPEAMLKKIVGHTENMDTLGVYGHKVDGDANKAADIISNVFKRII